MKKCISTVSAYLAEPKKVSHIYLATDLKTFTFHHLMRVGETRKGELTMTEEDEKFEFVERLTDSYTRNPTVFRGQYINVHRDKHDALVVTLRKNILTNRKDAMLVAEAIKNEYITAAKLLTL